MGTVTTEGPKFFELNTGDKLPALGLGTWQAESNVIGEVVKSAIKEGYRHIDCAYDYYNEKEIGDALQEMFKQNIVKREDLWITSKLWSSFHAPEHVPEGLDITLKNLQLDHLDLYLIHWPVALKRTSPKPDNPEDFAVLDIQATWAAMEKLVETGKVRAIGVSNFTVEKLQKLLAYAQITPAVNQVECHPVWQQRKLRSFCRSKGIHLSAYSPLGSPGSSFSRFSVLEHPVLKKVSERVGKTTAQVALRWGIQRGNSVLPKTTSAKRIKENFGIFDWSIPPEDFKLFSEIDQVRLFKADFWLNDSTSPYKTVDEIWDCDL